MTEIKAFPTIKNYEEAYIVCRSIGHAWFKDERTKKKRKGLGTLNVIVSGCGRCNMTRIITYNYKGERLTGFYRQPKGYALPGKSAHDFRREMFLREDRKEKNAQKEKVKND